MLIHKIDVQDDYMFPIYEAEKYLIDTCKEYSIDYSDCTLMNVHPVSEGIIGSIVQFIKAIFRKAIQLLVKIWKVVVGFLKMVISKIASFFKRLLGFKNESKEMEIKSIITVSPGKAEECAFRSVKDMESVHKRALQNFSSEIAKLEKDNISYTKQLERHSLRTVKEGFDIIQEKVVYKDTKTHRNMIDKTKSSSVFLASVKKRKDRKGYSPETNLNNILQGDYNNSDATSSVMGTSDEFSWANNNNVALFPMTTAYRSMITNRAHLSDIESMRNPEFEILAGTEDEIQEEIDLRIKDINHFYTEIKESSVKNLIIMGNNVPKGSYNSLFISYLKNLSEFAKECSTVLDIDTIVRKLADNMFPSFDHISNPEERANAIQKWINLRLNWNKGIIMALQTMIRLNGKKIRLDTWMIDSLGGSNNKSDGHLSSEDIKVVRQVVQNNMYRMISDDGAIIDGRKLGFRGIFIQSEERTTKWFSAMDGNNDTDRDYGASWVLNNPSKFDSLIVYLSKYDVTVLSHGGSENGEWIMQKTVLPNGSFCSTDDDTHTKVNDYVKALIKLGFKRINLMVCNPGHHKLDPEIIMSKKVLVHMATDSVLRAF